MPENRNNQINKYLKQIVLPRAESRKGENGRVLVIGGSKLFHAASFWAATAAAKVVDMVHFSSPATENNELMRIKAKQKFWDGIVVPWEDLPHYIEEDDCILVGPGMERGEETKQIVDELLASYSQKKWVVDGGALQMVDPKLLNEKMIITPNMKERAMLEGRVAKGVTMLAKGPVDVVTSGGERVEIAGGSAGMTKGGTGDVLSGIVAGLYANSPAMAAAVVGSYTNKRAGEAAANKYGTYFSAIDLLPELQKVMSVVLR